MIYNEKVRCANCSTESEQRLLASTNAFVSADLDLRPPEMQRSTMECWLQPCPSCSYCAGDISEPPLDPAVFDSASYRSWLLASEYPELARRFLACAFAMSAHEPMIAAHRYLQAAWICDDKASAEKSRTCRKLAAEQFDRCAPFEDSGEGITDGAVVVDVLRRSGEMEAAKLLGTQLLEAKSATGLLRTVLEYQLRLAESADIAAHQISDCE